MEKKKQGYKIREVTTIQEIEKILKEINYLFETPLSASEEERKKYVQKLFCHASVWIAEDKDKWLSVLAGYKNDIKKGAFVSFWVVNPEEKKIKTSRAGIEVLEEFALHCIEEGFQNVRFQVSKTNTRAMKIYLGIGGTVEKEDTDSYTIICSREVCINFLTKYNYKNFNESSLGARQLAQQPQNDCLL